MIVSSFLLFNVHDDPQSVTNSEILQKVLYTAASRYIHSKSTDNTMGNRYFSGYQPVTQELLIDLEAAKNRLLKDSQGTDK